MHNNNDCFIFKTNDLNTNGLEEDKSIVNTNTLFIVNNTNNNTTLPPFATSSSSSSSSACAYEIFCKNNNYDPYDVVNRIYLAFLWKQKCK